MRRFALFFAVFLTAMASAAQTVPELFQKGKAQVKGEAWKDALATFKQVEADAAKPENEAYRKQLEGPLAFYRGVCQSNLDLAEDARANFEMFLRGHAQRLDGSRDVLEEGRRGVRAGEERHGAASGCRQGRRRALDFQQLPGVQAAAQHQRAAEPDLGRRAGVVAHDGATRRRPGRS